MPALRTFFQRSYWFWVISRIAVVLLFVISMVQIMGEGDLRHPDEVLVNAMCLVGALVQGILAVIELARGTKPAVLRISGGLFLVLFSVGLLVLFAIGPVKDGLAGVLLIVAIWFLLLGLRDLLVR
jgi:hypothetical protein